MIKHKDHFHGSDLEKIEQIYGIKKEEIVRFFRKCQSAWRITASSDRSLRADRCDHDIP